MTWQTFAWVVGQDDNIGDVLLRRRMLAPAIARSTTHLYLRGCSASFREALDLGPGTTTYTSLGRWLAAVVLSRRRSGRTLLLDAGEIRTVGTDTAKYLFLAPVLLLCRARGDRVVSIGSGTREATPVGTHLVSAVFGLSSALVWRDEWSRQVFGRGTSGPDWAFGGGRGRALGAAAGDGAPDEADRPLMAITFRAETTPHEGTLLEGLRSACRDLGLRPVVFVQVAHDGPAAARLADLLGAELLPWDGETHLQQEARVRAMLGRSLVVVSDRIHALILGMTEGAAPVGAVPGPDLKVGRSLAPAGVLEVSADVRMWSAEQVRALVVGVADRRSDVLRAVEHAHAVVSTYDDVVAPPTTTSSALPATSGTPA